jgi:hypothetical protein
VSHVSIYELTVDVCYDRTDFRNVCCCELFVQCAALGLFVYAFGQSLQNECDNNIVPNLGPKSNLYCVTAEDPEEIPTDTDHDKNHKNHNKHSNAHHKTHSDTHHKTENDTRPFDSPLPPNYDLHLPQSPHDHSQLPGSPQPPCPPPTYSPQKPLVHPNHTNHNHNTQDHIIRTPRNIPTIPASDIHYDNHYVPHHHHKTHHKLYQGHHKHKHEHSHNKQKIIPVAHIV